MNEQQAKLISSGGGGGMESGSSNKSSDENLKLADSSTVAQATGIKTDKEETLDKGKTDDGIGTRSLKLQVIDIAEETKTIELKTLPKHGNKFVEYVLAAEFDIDKGSTLRHAYPHRVDGYEDEFFAEHMLPEGAHNREQDWTCFVVNRDTPPTSNTHLLSLDHSRRGKQEETLFKCLVSTTSEIPRATTGLQGKQQYAYSWVTQFNNLESEIFIISVNKKSRTIKLSYPVVSNQDSFAIAAGDLWLETPLDSRSEQEPLEKLDYRVIDPFSGTWAHVSGSPGFQCETRDQLADSSRPRFTRLRATFESESDRELFEFEISALLGVPHVAPPFYYCYNIVSNRLDAQAKRGATVRALAIASRYPFFHVLEPIITLAIDEYFSNPTIEVLEKVHSRVNAINFRVLPVLSRLDRQLLRRHVDRPHTPSSASACHLHVFRGLVQWASPQGGPLQVPVSIPYLCEPDEMGGASISLLLSLFGPQVMKIFNAVLQEKKILFLAKMAPAGDVCQAVLATCSLLCPPLRGFAQRAFPYANLNDLSWLQAKGYIAGVTNPVFEGRSNWWDLLCNLDDGTVTVSESLAVAPPEQRPKTTRHRSPSPRKRPPITPSRAARPRGREEADLPGRTPAASATWFGLSTAEDESLISRILDGHNANFGDEWAKAQFRDYAEELLSMACGDYGTEQFQYPERNYSQDVGRGPDLVGAMQLVFASTSAELRIQQWRYTALFSNLVRQRKVRLEWWRQHRKLHGALGTPGPIPGAWEYLRGGKFDMRRGVKKLHSGAELSDRELLDIYQTLATLLVHENDLKELLILLPETTGGLTAVARGLFHHSELIRTCTVQLLRRMEQFPDTKPAVLRLNSFILSAYHRQLNKTLAET